MQDRSCSKGHSKCSHLKSASTGPSISKLGPSQTLSHRFSSISPCKTFHFLQRFLHWGTSRNCWWGIKSPECNALHFSYTKCMMICTAIFGLRYRKVKCHSPHDYGRENSLANPCRCSSCNVVTYTSHGCCISNQAVSFTFWQSHQCSKQSASFFRSGTGACPACPCSTPLGFRYPLWSTCIHLLDNWMGSIRTVLCRLRRGHSIVFP